MDKELKCKNRDHTINNNSLYLHVQDQQEVIQCYEFILQKQINTEDLISYNQALKNENSTIIWHWPPKLGSNLVNKIHILTSQDKKSKFINQIENFFGQLEVAILDKIKAKKKEVLSQFEQFDLDSKSLINVYNEIADKSQLTKIIEEADNDHQKINQSLQQFFKQKIQQADENRKKLIHCLEEYESEKNVKEYLKNDNLNEQIHPYSSSIFALTNLIYPTSSLNSKSIQTILKKYPIFDLQQLPKVSKCLPVQYVIVKSTYSSSSSFTIYKELNSTHIYSNNNQGTVYSNYILNNSKKYIIRFKTNLPFFQMNNTIIGLVCQDYINTDISKSSACLNFNSQSGLEQVKNHWLYTSSPPSYEQINEIEMRVCIDENTLVFTDYPNYKTYCFKKPREQSSQKMDQTKQWRIGVYMEGNCGTNKIVTIQQFLEVDQLPTF